MFEYTRALLNPFPWMKSALDYTYGLSQSQDTVVDQETLTAPVYNTISQSLISIQTDSDWNTNSLQQLSTLGAMYKAVDQADSYLTNMFTLMDARLKESEQRVKEIEDGLKSVRNVLGLSSSTQITVRGGDRQWVDQNPDFYKDSGQLEFSEEEGVFRLADTGFFSSIRSLGGFAGQVVIERQLGQLVQSGNLQDIADGSRYTFWSGTHYSPAPLRADSNDLPWLPEKYKHGYAFMLTYYLDRPTLVSEIFVDPITTEPIDLVAVTYSPYGQSNVLTYNTFETSGGWTFPIGTARVAASGVGGTYALMTSAVSSWAHTTFDIATSLSRTVSGNQISANSADVWDSRVDFTYTMKGVGDCKCGARLVWLDSSGEVVSYKLKEDFPTGFYRTLRLVDFAPPTAVSGRVELGIFTPAYQASAYFDEVSLKIGEQKKNFSHRIDRPTTLLLKNKTGAILSNRFSFIFAQRNPRREVLSKEHTQVNVFSIQGDPNIDPVIQKDIESMGAALTNPGPGNSLFAYRFGFKELDLRYREFVPRGTLVSLPIDSRKEIRRLWVAAEFTKGDSDGVEFFTYPYNTDNNYKVSINPWMVGSFDSTQTNMREGDIMYVYTKEEVASGWVIPNEDDVNLIVDTRSQTDYFEGTDREGRVKLTYPAHLRRPFLDEVRDWLDEYSIRPAAFDPNAETLYGIATLAARNLIKSGDISTLTLNSSSIANRAGYVPLRVEIKTDKWTASQDVFGKPDNNTIKTVSRELLTETSMVDTITNTQREVMGFSSWLNTTGFLDFLAQGAADPLFTALKDKATASTKLADLIKNQQFVNTVASLFQTSASQSTNVLQDKFNIWYNRFKADGKLTKEVDEVRVRTAAVEKDDVYRTKYSPIITGANGTFLSLFWANPTTGEFKPVSRNSYAVDAYSGLITMLVSAPSSSFTQVYAHYRYLAEQAQEDFSSSVLDFVTSTSTSLSDASTTQDVRGRSLPVCRNMTDYENGRVPKLRLPNFDRLSADYYPIIEYYLTSDNYLQFSRDFSRIGDMPVFSIKVVSDTLALSPRTSVEVTRTGAPTSSTSVSSFSLLVKEASLSPSREVE